MEGALTVERYPDGRVDPVRLWSEANHPFAQNDTLLNLFRPDGHSRSQGRPGRRVSIGLFGWSYRIT